MKFRSNISAFFFSNLIGLLKIIFIEVVFCYRVISKGPLRTLTPRFFKKTNFQNFIDEEIFLMKQIFPFVFKEHY